MMLTRRQRQLLDYLERYMAARGYAPTLHEIGRHFGLTSLATVHKHLGNLERKGAIRRLPNRSRALELARARGGARAVTVPLLGRVAAGAPIEPVEGADTIDLPEELVGRGETFVLQVRGDSMIEEGILDGDHIVVEARATASPGETAVVLVRGEATVKRFFPAPGGRVRLQPANERLPALVVPARDVEVRGVVVAVLRKYRRAPARPAGRAARGR